jgi:putative tricarboxylic transport membrane protein
MEMKKFDTLSGLFLLILSLAICIGSLRLHVGTFRAPGAGLFPLITGVVLGVFSILILLEARRKTEAATQFWVPGADIKAIFLSSLVILIYALFLERLGFLASTLLFFVLISRFVSGHRWTTALFFAVVASAATYSVFKFLLRSPLPAGILERFF